MIDPREALLADLDLLKSRIIYSPGFIVVCGGPISVLAGQECCSARNVFLAHLAANDSELHDRRLLPEEIKAWNHFNVYSDLLAFETDLAHLTGAVVLFVESPGSIAELGSFSCIPDLASKLLVILRANHYADDSFIRLGPVKSLEDAHPDSVCVYTWNADNSNFANHAPHLTQTLKAFIGKTGKSESFSSASVKHRLLLIADLIDLFVLVRETEIKDWLDKYFSIQLKLGQLKQYLFLLKNLKLIRDVGYGNNRYLIAEKDSVPYIEYATKTIQFRQERARLKINIQQYYESEDKTRIGAWKSVQAESGGNAK